MQWNGYLPVDARYGTQLASGVARAKIGAHEDVAGRRRTRRLHSDGPLSGPPVKRKRRYTAMEIPRTNPRTFIFPLFEGPCGTRLVHFLGTCYLAGDRTTVVTAHHNIKGSEGPFCIIDESQECEQVAASVVGSIERVDLAVLRLLKARPSEPLQLEPSRKLGVGTDIWTLEYSDTRVVDGSPELAPATRKGYASRRVPDPRRGGLPGRWLFELSFPALRGASGAPVINEWDGRVYATIVANVSYHLLPAQIEEVLDEHNEIMEHTRFLLPQGLAVPNDELTELLGGR